MKLAHSRAYRLSFGTKTPPARIILVIFVLLALPSRGLSDDRTVIHPGFDLFSPQQDIELGKKASMQVPRQFVLLSNKRVDQYLQRLGMRLAAHAPGYKYPYQYRCINSETINAFALPGGFIYINRGVIENADDEAQLAAVMAHETAHVALRHGTSQATKAYAAEAGISIVSVLMGGNTAASLMGGLWGGGRGHPHCVFENVAHGRKPCGYFGRANSSRRGIRSASTGGFFRETRKAAAAAGIFQRASEPRASD